MARAPIVNMAQAKRAFDQSNFEEAERICRAALRQDRRTDGAHELLAVIALRRFRYEEALSHYRRCAKIKPRVAGYAFLVGKVLTLMGRYEEAIISYDKALAIDPGHRLASGWKSGTLERASRYAEALSVLDPWLSEGTEQADMAELAAKLYIHLGRHEDAIVIAQRHIGREETRDGDRKGLQYQLGRAYEKLGEYDRSFEAFRAGNDITKALLPKPFNPETYVKFADLVIGTFTKELLAGLPRAKNDTKRPVFIAGMPRSGTTLVEQIIDAHPDAFGAGELMDIDRVPHRLPEMLGATTPYPRCMPRLTDAVVNRLANEYLTKLSLIARHASRIVNKSLENYKNLGLIRLMFPGAKIIHCRRNPLDVCLSCYMGGFHSVRAPWIADLEHLGVVHRQYERLMAHWRDVLDLDMIEVVYEDVVEDVETQARRIVEHLELGWDDRCLRFHESSRPVLTLSYAQVTKPIYRTAMGRHAHYDKHLGPLKKALEA